MLPGEKVSPVATRCIILDRNVNRTVFSSLAMLQVAGRPLPGRQPRHVASDGISSQYLTCDQELCVFRSINDSSSTFTDPGYSTSSRSYSARKVFT